MAAKADFSKYDKAATLGSLRKTLEDAQKKLAERIAAHDDQGADRLRDIIANLQHTLGH
ncbi:MAG: hypothetical protein K2L95_03945 [Alphaproteobacteria bacterium]|nr:hypothetical protein [Alphaproteobacteria bacterium]MDE6571335.1 hypothetical protein [Alphaproteobacteria bacterium]